ncbi:hypothetical protein SGCOL_005553 [Colletotrichum sp. CLE4]
MGVYGDIMVSPFFYDHSLCLMFVLTAFSNSFKVFHGVFSAPYCLRLERHLLKHFEDIEKDHSRPFSASCQEIGLSLSNLNDDDFPLADHGVDSMLSLTLTGRMREDLGIDVDFSAFITWPTLGQLKAFLGFTVSETSTSSGDSGASGPPTESEPDTSTTLPSDDEQSEINKAVDEDMRSVSRAHIPLYQFRATSTLLQGSTKRARSTLFLLLNGSGSATSYASLPSLQMATLLYTA